MEKETNLRWCSSSHYKTQKCESCCSQFSNILRTQWLLGYTNTYWRTWLQLYAQNHDETYLSKCFSPVVPCLPLRFCLLPFVSYVHVSSSRLADPQCKVCSGGLLQGLIIGNCVPLVNFVKLRQTFPASSNFASYCGIHSTYGPQTEERWSFPSPSPFLPPSSHFLNECLLLSPLQWNVRWVSLVFILEQRCAWSGSESLVGCGTSSVFSSQNAEGQASVSRQEQHTWVHMGWI